MYTLPKQASTLARVGCKTGKKRKLRNVGGCVCFGELLRVINMWWERKEVT